MTFRDELEAELGYVRMQLARVEQAPRDAATEYDTVRFMWVSRARALEAEIASLCNGEFRL